MILQILIIQEIASSQTRPASSFGTKTIFVDADNNLGLKFFSAHLDL